MARFDVEISLLTDFKRSIYEWLSFTGRSGGLNAEQVAEMNGKREWLNRNIPLVSELITKAGISTKTIPSSPHIQSKIEVDLFSNLFNLWDYNLDYRDVGDVIDRAIGRYQHSQSTWQRTRMNPLFWIGEFIRLPFKIISWAGFKGESAEQSTLGKLYKLVMGIGAFLGTAFKFVQWIVENFDTLKAVFHLK